MMFDPISSATERRLVLSAARSLRAARDAGKPILPALYATLEDYRCGMLAPVLASLIALVEACAPGAAAPEQERRLLTLLEDGSQEGPAPATEASPLSVALRGAVRSTRVMIAMALESAGSGRLPARMAVAG
jgi:hypothetical protein